MLKILCLLIFGLALSVKGHDVLCEREHVQGKWIFFLREGDANKPCSKRNITSTYKVELKDPNIAVDEDGNEGKWTMMKLWAFEVVIHGRKYFSYFESDSNCTKSRNMNSTHDIYGRDWYCFHAEKEGKINHRMQRTYRTEIYEDENDDEIYEIDEKLIEKINSDPNILWYAKKNEKFEGMTIGEMKRLTQGDRYHDVKPVEASQELKDAAAELPESFDWRNVDGVNYINPPRDQSGCGSCYAFASTAMNEARLNIATKGRINVTLSPQDVINCNELTNGCHGGYSFPVAGKFAEDFGMVEENCVPYEARERECKLKRRKHCKKHYFTNYEYVGGYYGNCNEEVMLLDLFKNGPLSVGMLAPKYFIHGYGGGVFHEIDNVSNGNPFHPTNHAVLIVGYGVEESTNTKYWSVKNSWGDDWGENGFFRIRRGTNECGIESNAFQSFPIF